MKKILGGFLFCFALIGCTEDTTKLEATAETYTKKLGYEFKGASCVNTDGDNDGYVSCSVNIGQNEPLQVECASHWGTF